MNKAKQSPQKDSIAPHTSTEKILDIQEEKHYHHLPTATASATIHEAHEMLNRTRLSKQMQRDEVSRGQVWKWHLAVWTQRSGLLGVKGCAFRGLGDWLWIYNVAQSGLKFTGILLSLLTLYKDYRYASPYQARQLSLLFHSLPTAYPCWYKQGYPGANWFYHEDIIYIITKEEMKCGPR